MGEKLLKIVEQRLVLFAEHGQGRIHAHGAGGLGPVPRHGEEGVLHFFISIAEGLVQPVPQLLRVVLHLPVGNGDVLEVNQMLVQPFAVRTAAGIAPLQLGVVHQPPKGQIRQQHPSGLQTGLFHDFFRGDVQNAYLGGEDQRLVVREIPAAGAKAVPVQHRAHRVSVGKDDGGGAVPRLHHGGIIVIEVPLFPVHPAVVGPRLGKAQHHRLRQGNAVHHQKFQRVVQHGGIRPVLIHHGENFVHVLLHDRREHGFLPGQHPVHVAPDGVDFSVVHDIAVGMGALPAWICVGGKPGVDQCDGAFAVRVGEVGIKFPKLPHQKHSLIHNSAAGKRGDVGGNAGLLEDPPGNIQLAVKVQSLGAAFRTLYKALADMGHTAPGLIAQHVRAGGNLPPA